MKIAKQLLLTAMAAMVCTSAVLAGPPLDGTYQSPAHPTPDLLVGRHSESWSAPAGMRTNGNAINAASFDGASLGTQWWYNCPTTVSTMITMDNRDVGGTGNVSALIFYTTGGSFWLSGTGAWANGDPDYPGIIDSYLITVDETWVNGVRQGTDENVTMSGHFLGSRYPCFQWSANGAEFGNTDTMALPADYPAFLAGFTCLPTPTLGNWSTQDDITFSIFSGGCTVSTHDTTWGAIKDLYRN